VTARTRRKAPNAPAWFNAWGELSPAVRHGISLAVLAVVAIAFMAPELFSNRVLVGGDIVHWKAMAQSLFEWESQTGQKPLWDTNPFMGMPAFEISYTNGVPQVDTLARLFRELLWPTSHLLILFGGMYGLVVTLTRDNWAGVFSAIAFGLTTYLPILLVAGHNSKFVALAFVPWLFWSYAYARRSPSLFSGLVFAVATAVSLRAGHIQITYFAAFTLAVWWLVEAIIAVRRGEAKELARSTGWLVLGGILGLLMVAHPYLAKAQYKQFTIRGASPGAVEGGLAWDYAMGWSQGWAEMLTLAVANAFGGGGSTYWGAKVFTAGPHYVGGVTLLLAAYAVGASRNRTVWGLGVAGLFMLGFALGENLEWLNRFMFEYFPLFSAFRVPETWLSMVAAVLAILAGFGIRAVVRRTPDAAEDREISQGIDRFGLVAVSLAAAIMLLGGSLLSFERPDEFETFARQVAATQPDISLDDPRTVQLMREQMARWQDERKDLFAADARRTFFFVLVAVGLLALMRRRRIPGWAAQAGLVLLVALDLGGVGRRYFNEDVLVPSRLADNPVREFGFDSYLQGIRDEAGGPGRFRVLSLEGNPVVTARPAYFHETLGGYHGAKLRRYQDFLDEILFRPGSGLPTRNGLLLSNTRYVAAQGSLPGMAPVYSDDDGFLVFEVPDALPRAFFVDSLVVRERAEDQWALLRDSSFDVGRVAVVGEALDLTPAADSLFSSVELERYSPDEIVWNVQTDVPRLFVASEVYYPAGWEALVDDEPTEILPVDYLLRGVVIPQGSHRIIMRFRPGRHRIGMAISATATAGVYGLLLVLLFMGWRRRG
jgi:hypothetical protein